MTPGWGGCPAAAAKSRLVCLLAYASFVTIAYLHMNREALGGGCSGSASAPSSVARANSMSMGGAHAGGCGQLGLPRPVASIPLRPEAYTADRGATSNFFVSTVDRDLLDPPLLMAMPMDPRLMARVRGGRMEVRDNGDVWTRTAEADPRDGAFVDVGGWVGDTSLPSAAAGIDTYVFEPVRRNTDMIHLSVGLNECHVSEHLVIINAMVGDHDSPNESVYVTPTRSDNSAATEAQATEIVGMSAGDYEQPVDMITLDSFFPEKGFPVQNLKIDVQGFELHVLRGAERLLRENRDRVVVKLEFHEKLLATAGTDPADLLAFMSDLGFHKTAEEGIDIEFRGRVQ